MRKLSICFFTLISLFMTGCGNNEVKEVTTVDNFTKVAMNNNLVVTDNMDSYSDIDYIVDAKVARLNDIEIEMIKYTNTEYATKVQENHIESFNLLKSTGAAEEKDKGSNYYRYVLVSNGRYMISVRVDDTLVFSKSLLVDKDTVSKIFNEIGY